MKIPDAITILRAAGMEDAVAVLEKVTTFKRPTTGIDMSQFVKFSGLLIYRHEGRTVAVAPAPFERFFSTEEEAVKSDEECIPMVTEMNEMQKKAQPGVEISFITIRTDIVVVKQHDINRKAANE